VSLDVVLERVVGILGTARVPYMLTGSLAAAYYATPRATQDVDVVIDPPEAGLRQIVDQFLSAGYYVDRDAALAALESRGQFNVIDPDSGWKVDLIIRKERPFSEAEFDRRATASLLGVEVSLATPEDLLLAKLEWAKLADSALQRRDVLQLLERSLERMDLQYVEHWIQELGLEAEWSRIQEQRSESLDRGESSDGG
jgi:hypothetical protein